MQSGLYVHVPFCRRRCPYCDFTLIESDGSFHDQFLKRLLREMKEVSGDHPSWSSDALHFGGGSPSILPAADIHEIIQCAQSSFGLKQNAEITLEVNPEDADSEYLRDLHQAGVNRISFGTQSFDDRELTLLGREHSSVTARSAFSTARNAGFDNINIDLIFGIPGSTILSWTTNLHAALSLNPEHLSLYGLTYEQGTPPSPRPSIPERFRNVRKNFVVTNI